MNGLRVLIDCDENGVYEEFFLIDYYCIVGALKVFIDINAHSLGYCLDSGGELLKIEYRQVSNIRRTLVGN